MENKIDYIAIMDRWNNRIRNGMENLQKISKQSEEVFKRLEKGIENVNNFVECLQKIDYQKLLNGFEEGIAIEIENINKYLLDRNWYLPNASLNNMGNISNIISNKNMTDEEKYSAIDITMQKIVLENIEDLKSNLNSRFKERQLIFKEMFKSYYEENYILCIPVMLAQIEGICNEILGVNFFSKEYKTYYPKTRKVIENKVVEKNINKLNSAQLIPLYFVSEIFKRTDDENILNRHNILHGTSCNYGSRLNADKCIALIGFLLNVDNIVNKEIYAE
ncbi:hypothetical protein QYB58_001026 [Clostridium perfringens]|nr:hypothetical protein [Clostridium perfringens]HAT4295061.1 hypothetical protein [Clostridium perfringens]